MKQTKDFTEELNQWNKLKEIYTTEELLNWIRSYARQITILTDIIEDRCKKEEQ